MLTETQRRRRGHRFFPSAALRVPALRSTDGQGKDAIVHVHYFVGGADWYVTEYDAETGESFGWAEILPGGGELGYTSLAELETVAAGPLRQPVERDMHWERRSLRLVLADRRGRVAQ